MNVTWGVLGARWILAATAALACGGAFAQSVQITGAAGGAGSDGFAVGLTFSCSGAPTCIGNYSGYIEDTGCSNAFQRAGTFTLTGFSLTSIGPIQGTVTLGAADFSDTLNADGTCTIKPGTDHDFVNAYSGYWDGKTGVFTVVHVDTDGSVHEVGGTFTVQGSTAQPPPFQMTVTTNVTATNTSATADIQYPAADVGKNESVYVFAYAPAGLVQKSAALLRKDGADTCVLAQLDPSGQLSAASNSSLVPYASGVLSAQGQSVTVLNNATNSQVAGATFFVGYGTDSSSMIAGGVNRNAVSVPGTTQCPSVFPATPGALTGLWWNASESGWGVHFTQRRNVVFAAWYTYDASGAPKWYVASDCEMAAAGATSGRCTGKLYQVTGPTFFGAAFDPTLDSVTEAGSLQVDFADPDHATMTYTAQGVTRSVPIVRQVFRTGATAPAVDYTDLWWNPSESGWGMAISHEYDVMFLAWFVYDAGGVPAWYVVTDCVVTGNGCLGTLYRTSGPPPGPTFDPARVQAAAVGSATVTFTDPNNGLLNYTVNGVTGSKTITRQIF